MTVTLLVPMKPPHVGKSRLRGALASPVSPGSPDGAGMRAAEVHTSLVLALARDTVSAALDTPGVDRVVVVTGDVDALTPLAELGAEIVDDRGAPDLNTALRAAEPLVRAPCGVAAGPPGAGGDRGDRGVVGALQADLPALRSSDLAAALAEADGRRAFTADRHGTGTTLLLSAPGEPLAPDFGPGSAHAHARSGAVALTTAAASLRSDVDTPSDLRHARTLGLGPSTTELLGRAGAVPAAAHRPEG
ncbi:MULTISPECIES: 2-phospho-L-lactate guanylyltransferase [Prauserella salsuginis group]|uniref:Phosphoenolpyruvate guanylyltransferase n=1 Tax=Prauserella salsuginis TaxID=387889 RepID=A0ABW6G930_9PSEU|nr:MULTISPECIES: 2-phospho-L-lactate guanylyltransferase [Prauserella salsuginis group]